MKRYHLDFETRSEVDLKKVGAWAYAQHPTTQVLCMAIKREDWSHRPLLLTQEELKAPQAIEENAHFVAHNALFEYAIWHFILHKRYGWPAFWNPKHWSCTYARASMVNLPGSLAAAAEALGLPAQKDLEGRAIMLRLCKPLSKLDALGGPVFDNDTETLGKLYEYCRKDVETEEGIDGTIPKLVPHERAVWEMDLRINLRGVPVDTMLAQAAVKMSEELIAPLNEKLFRLTKGAVNKASRVAAIKNWMATQGVEVDSLNKEALTSLLAHPEILPQGVQEVLKIRRQVGKSSVAKYAAIMRSACSDGRVRGVLQFHVAHTGRWGGRLIQPQNFPQGFGPSEQARAIDLILTGDSDMFKLMYGDGAMDALASTLRGAICASEGHSFLGGDYNAIEPKILFWLAGAIEVLNTYRRGGSPYIDMANYIFRTNIITKYGSPKEYKLGKATILGCGYSMGAPTFRETVLKQTGEDIGEETAKLAVDSYREKYRPVVNMWEEVNNAAMNAVSAPGSVQLSCGNRVSWGMSRTFPDFLVCRLPAGRYLWYYKPSVKLYAAPMRLTEEEKAKRVVDGKPIHYRPRPTLHYWGTHPISKKWVQRRTYGGSLVENVVQAIARDVMVNGMHNCEKAGYPLVLTVHDELLSEVRESKVGDTTLEQYLALMCDLPSWAKGLPITAEGWVGKRYRK